MTQVWDVEIDGRHIRVNTGRCEISRIQGTVTFRDGDLRGERCCNEESIFAAELGDRGERIVTTLGPLAPRTSVLIARNSFKLCLPNEDERMIERAKTLIDGLEVAMIPQIAAVA
ncbi:MAG: hypothetical protein ABSD10_01415 [Candidatus Saccharimonadales bacterium]|jgi:hypothetical protein